MPAPKLGLTNAMGFGAGADVLRDFLVKEELRKIATAQAAAKAQQEAFENDLKLRAATLDATKVADAQRQFLALAPSRDAETALRRAQGAELDRKPAEAATAFERELTQDERRAQLEGGLIGQRGASAQELQRLTAASAQDLKRLEQSGEKQFIALRGAEDRQTAAAGASGGKLPASTQNDLITMKTVENMIDQSMALGTRIGWTGVGGLWKGSVNQWLARNFGAGSKEQQSLRNWVGNIKGTIAQLRGGTSFTPNEQQLLETYAPVIDDHPKVLKQKLEDLKQFIVWKRANTTSSAEYPAATALGSAAKDPGAPAAEPVITVRFVNGKLVKGGG